MVNGINDATRLRCYGLTKELGIDLALNLNNLVPFTAEFKFQMTSKTVKTKCYGPMRAAFSVNFAVPQALLGAVLP